jgi:PPE-repeat protein
MLPTPPIWHAVPPEVHSTLLNVGGTPAGITAAGASWADLAAQYAAAIGELEGILSYVQSSYQGPSAEQFVAAHQPMLIWFADVVAKASEAAAAHAAITGAYTTAVATMPTMPELITNHVVHGVLVGTNFFGVNTIPIGMNEADYVRMWNQAGDVMGTWDGVSTSTVDTIVETPPSPITLIPGVGESGSIAATAASFLTQAEATAGGAALTGADMMGSTLLVKKAATSPASIGDKMPGPQTSAQGAAQQQDEAQQGPQNAASSFMQQASSMASSAPQAVSSAIQGPAQMLTQAPQTLAQAPQQLGSMLSQFAGSGGSSLGQPAGAAMPVGFPGTGAISGLNPAGMTSLAGGAFGSGPSRPLMPSTWGASPASTAELASSARGISPVATGLPGAGASGSGAGGGGMMGSGAHNRRKGSSDRANTYADDAVDEDADADNDGGTFAMAR